MNKNLSQTASLASESSKIQNSYKDKASIENSVFQKKFLPPFIENMRETQTTMMQRRTELKRSPLSGVSNMIQNLSSNQASQAGGVASELLKSTQKMNSRILEAWINNTVADAEHLDIPGCILKPENRLPLVRYGIDRASLENAGLPASEVGKLYRSLFVYSIGFYQMILKVLEHTNNKYTIVTGIWKVFAVLLEYCCQLDYQMIINTLNLEKREEMEQLEAEYKAQIQEIQEQEKHVQETLNQSRIQLQQVQRDLQKEIQKRQDLEDELMQRGSGHEEEVALRLRFEAKLNEMFAKQRDFETRIGHLNEKIAEQQELYNKKVEQLAHQKKKAEKAVEIKVEKEHEAREAALKYEQISVVNQTLEDKLTEALEKIKELNHLINDSSNTVTDFKNQIAQKNIRIEDLKSELEVIYSQKAQVEDLLKDLKGERTTYEKRISELETVYSEECEKHNYYQQEYSKIKESDILKTVELNKYKDKVTVLQKENYELRDEKSTLEVQLENETCTVEEFKVQTAKTNEWIEKMNKARRVIEEQNDNLSAQLASATEQLNDYKAINLELKSDIEKRKNKEIDLENQITNLNIKMQSAERQYETRIETLEDRIANLNQILESEKKVRESWIQRYEEEQKSHSATVKELHKTQEELNQSKIHIQTLTSSTEDSGNQIDNYLRKNKELSEENNELRIKVEEFQRKSRTSEMLIKTIETEYKATISELNQEIETIKEQNFEEVNRCFMETERVWKQAEDNLELYYSQVSKTNDLSKVIENKNLDIQKEQTKFKDLLKNWEGIKFQAEELRHFIEYLNQVIAQKDSEILENHQSIQALETKLESFNLIIPEELREENNPFEALYDKINQSEETISSLENQIESFKEQLEFYHQKEQNKNDAETQFEFLKETSENEVQTEVDMSSFDKVIQEYRRQSARNSRESARNSREKPKTPGSQSSQRHRTLSSKSIKNSSQHSLGSEVEGNFPLRKRISQEDPDKPGNINTQKSYESVPREDGITPVNLKSMYKHEGGAFFSQTGSSKETPKSAKLPQITKKGVKPTPPTQQRPEQEIKRHFRQVASRMKNETNF